MLSMTTKGETVLNLPVSQNYLLITNPQEYITYVMRKITKSRQEFCCYLTRTASFCSESNPKKGVWWQSIYLSPCGGVLRRASWRRKASGSRGSVCGHCLSWCHLALTCGWLVHLIWWVRGHGKNVLWDLKRQIKLLNA